MSYEWDNKIEEASRILHEVREEGRQKLGREAYKYLSLAIQFCDDAIAAASIHMEDVAAQQEEKEQFKQWEDLMEEVSEALPPLRPSSITQLTALEAYIKERAAED